MATLTILAGKGGVGKSTVARYLAHRARERKTPLALFDADPSNYSLSRYYKDATSISSATESGQIKFLTDKVWPATGQGDALVDLGAGRDTIFAHWAHRSNLVTLAEGEGVKISVLGVLGTEVEGLSSLAGCFQATQGARHTMVLNHKNGEEDDDFSDVMEHVLFKKLAGTGAAVVRAPTMFGNALKKLQTEGITFELALVGAPTDDGTARISPIERQWIISWLRGMDASLKEVP
ncbi:MAG: P-loop NTPase [Alphaproteobacteria bacterium]|nr:P-loop NTPase [Alphaproteobacteria bacterium]